MDPKWAECIDHAHAKGLGVSVMGPVGGGRLAQPIPAIQALLPQPGLPTHRLALRFVLSNPAVDVTLSGMQEAAFLEENAALASQEEPLSPQEYQQIHATLEEKRELAKLYCTGCLYCMPCRAGVEIPKAFEYLIAHKVYGVTGWARAAYAALAGKASLCRDCGACEKKCPQHIPIRQRLKEVVEVLERPAPARRPGDQVAMKGFHRDEGGSRWMTRQGVIRIPAVTAPGGSQFTFSLSCGEARHYPSFPFRVRFWLAGKAAQEAVFSSSKQSISFVLPLADRTPAELHLASDAWFVPCKSGINADPRELSVRIGGLAISGRSNHPPAPAPSKPKAAAPAARPEGCGAEGRGGGSPREFLKLIQDAGASLARLDAAAARARLASAHAMLGPGSAVAKPLHDVLEVVGGAAVAGATPEEAALRAQRLVDFARLLAQAGVQAGAEGFLQYSLHLDPQCRPAHALLGRQRLAQGQLLDALRYLSVAWALDARDMTGLNELASCYEKSGDAAFAEVLRKRSQVAANRPLPARPPTAAPTRQLGTVPETIAVS
jgi:ferredoxin